MATGGTACHRDTLGAQGDSAVGRRDQQVTKDEIAMPNTGVIPCWAGISSLAPQKPEVFRLVIYGRKRCSCL